MTTVYLVTTGEYSDFSVNGVFSTRERAERLAAVLDYYPEIMEYELNAYGDAPIRKRFDVIVHPDTSEVLDVRDEGIFQTETPRVVEHPNWHYSVTTEMFGEKGTFSANITALRAVVYAEDKDKALKLATDAVAKYKAQKERL